jgi:hypothetical protein
MRPILKYRTLKILSGFGVLLLTLLGSLFLSSCEKDMDEDVWGNIDPNPIPDTSILKDFPVIDVHQHIYNSANFWFTGFDHIPFNKYDKPSEHYFALVQKMKDNNVVLAIAGSNLTAVDEYYEDYPENRSLFLYSAEYGKIENTFLPITLSKLRDAIKEQKIRSFGELTGIQEGIPFDDPSYMELYALADSFSLPVFIHTGIVPKSIYERFPLYAFEKSNPAYLKPVLEKFPDVNFNAAHFGISSKDEFDFEDDVIEMMKTYDNFYVDIGATIWWSTSGEMISKSFIKRAVDEGVVDKILFASDEMIWPDALTAAVNYIKQANYLTKDEKEKILYYNAATFLKLSEEEISEHFCK